MAIKNSESDLRGNLCNCQLWSRGFSFWVFPGLRRQSFCGFMNVLFSFFAVETCIGISFFSFLKMVVAGQGWAKCFQFSLLKGWVYEIFNLLWAIGALIGSPKNLEKTVIPHVLNAPFKIWCPPFHLF